MHPSRNLARHARAFALSALGLGVAGSALAAGYPAVTQQRLDDAASSTQWLTYYHSYGGESYSPARQVDTTFTGPNLVSIACSSARAAAVRQVRGASGEPR